MMSMRRETSALKENSSFEVSISLTMSSSMSKPSKRGRSLLEFTSRRPTVFSSSVMARTFKVSIFEVRDEYSYAKAYNEGRELELRLEQQGMFYSISFF